MRGSFSSLEGTLAPLEGPSAFRLKTRLPNFLTGCKRRKSILQIGEFYSEETILQDCQYLILSGMIQVGMKCLHKVHQISRLS